MDLFDDQFMNEDYAPQLFPDFNEKSLMDPVCQDDPFDVKRKIHRSSECQSDSGRSYESGDSGGEIDVGCAEHMYSTGKSSEADDELVSYLTNRPRDTNTNTLRDGVKIFRILKKDDTKIQVSNSQPRVMKLDSSGNLRMAPRIQVVRPAMQPALKPRDDVFLSSPESPTDSIRSNYSTNSRSLSKSAISARENREKKKKYVGDLEKDVKLLQQENKTIKQQNSSYENMVDRLKNEVAYLKNVLANQSTLSKLLQNIPGIPDISISASDKTSSLPSKRSSNSVRNTTVDDFEPTLKKRGVSTSATLKDETNQCAGVCLHVSGSAVSLEFCSSCNSKAKPSAL